MSEKVTILRKWNNPLIFINVTFEGIKMEMKIEDFITALAKEAMENVVKSAAQKAGNPAMLMTNAGLQKRLIESINAEDVRSILEEASKHVLEEVKRESSKVM